MRILAKENGHNRETILRFGGKFHIGTWVKIKVLHCLYSRIGQIGLNVKMEKLNGPEKVAQADKRLSLMIVAMMLAMTGE